MNELALFAGAGGGILGGKLLGWRTVCAVEINPFCREVLLRRQLDGLLPKFPVWDDIKTFDGKPWRGKVDIVSGGFPCQDISLAGKGAGICGERSGLWTEMARVVREVGPRYVIVENSPALVSRGLATVLADLAEMGFDAKWGVFGADNAGLDHFRKRMWVLAYSCEQGLKDDSRGAAHGIMDRRRGPCRNCWPQYENSQWVEVGPHLVRVVHGMAFAMDRIKAIGAGQVPAVVGIAFETLAKF